MKKAVVIGIILFFIEASVVSGFQATSSPRSLNHGGWLYVGGSGPGNYSSIQNAVENANPGDTIFVYDESSPYHENLVLDKSIALIGENPDTTIIDADEVTSTSTLIADGITLQGFTLRHQKDLQEELMDIITVYSNNNTISQNILLGEPFRRETMIALKNSSGNVISHNRLENVYENGLELRNSHDNEISWNVISGVLWKRGFGISLIDSSNNNITRNEISSLACCVDINELSQMVMENKITQNNFLRYYFRMSGVYFVYDYDRFQGSRGNIFDQNYWNRPQIVPKYVLGWIRLFWIPLDNYRYQLRVILPMFDLHPASTPYDIA